MTKKSQTLKSTEKIPYGDFAKVEMKIGKIVEINDHPNADKLYILTVDLGENKTRTIVAGLRNKYSKEQLIDKKAIFVTNLQPATLRGIESDGMILAAVSEDETAIISPDKKVEEGTRIR